MMHGIGRQQLADVGPALGIKRETYFHEGKNVTGIYQVICHAPIYRYQNAYDKVRRAERGSTG